MRIVLAPGEALFVGGVVAAWVFCGRVGPVLGGLAIAGGLPVVIGRLGN